MRSFIAMPGAILLLTILACGDDDNPARPAENVPLASSPAEFFTLFEDAYAGGDYETYAKLLHPDYQFHFLPDDPGDPASHPVWGLQEELNSAGNMMSGTENYNGIAALNTTIDITVQTFSTRTVAPAGKDAEEIWYDILTEVSLLVVTQDPGASDGSGIINRVVNSNQDFALRPDPEIAKNLLLGEQHDKNPITGKSVLPGATEATAWGDIKSLFHFTRVSGIEELLETKFEAAYAGRDSAAYSALLDSRYEFENLPNDPDDPANVETWAREDELRIAGRMFSGWENSSGVKVLDINFDQSVQSKAISNARFSDQPQGEVWYKAFTEVDLVVVTQDPSANDGSGILNRVVFSKQDYVIRPDPNDLDGWLIRRQIDREAITGKRSAGTENASWGEVKDLFK